MKVHELMAMLKDVDPNIEVMAEDPEQELIWPALARVEMVTMLLDFHESVRVRVEGASEFQQRSFDKESEHLALVVKIRT